MKSLLHNRTHVLVSVLFVTFACLSCNHAIPQTNRKPSEVTPERSAAGEVFSFTSSPRPMPKLAAAHKDGDWEYEVTFEPDPHEHEPYGISISYKGESIVGQPGDVVTTPWGILKCNRRNKWIAPSWYFGLTPADFEGNRDLTPISKDTIRPASHPTEEEVLADCIAILREHRTAECREAIQIIKRQGPNADSAVPHLIEVLKKEYDLSLVRPSHSLNTIPIIECLGFIGKGAQNAMPTLLKYTDHHDVNIRSSLVWSLFRISPDSDDTKKYILKSLRDESERVRAAAQSATQEMNKERNANKPDAGDGL